MSPKYLKVIVLGLLFMTTCSYGASRDTYADTWAATDGLGRAMPMQNSVGSPKSNKVVGVFYYLWMQAAGGGVYDNQKIIAANPANPAWGPVSWWHWWGEPKLGYYDSNDDFVIRKHAQMLTDAGVDVIIFDNTNAITYKSTVLKICQVYEDIKAHGGKVPKISFIFWSSPEATLQKVYDYLFAPGLYNDLWFQWQGKPLVMVDPSQVTSGTLNNYFTMRTSWAWTNSSGWFGSGQDKWPWLDNAPQKYGWHINAQTPEEIPVSPAQHPTGNLGRSFNGSEPTSDSQWKVATSDQGIYFAQQAQRALQVSPDFLWITQWNEWIAQRFLNGQNGFPFINPFAGRPATVGQTVFVDEYNAEFSRDMEPENGVNRDNYYYQMVDLIRRYKGVRAVPTAGPSGTQVLGNGFGTWNGVSPDYIDDINDNVHRNSAPFSHGTADSPVPAAYINNSGRNDLVVFRVGRDYRNLYFYARTAAPLSPATDAQWMLLYLNADQNASTGWNGYDYRLNNSRQGKTASLEQYQAGTWQKLADVPVDYANNELALTVPRSLFSNASNPANFDFKWTDNVGANPDIIDFMDQGDVAPNGRFNYRFNELSLPTRQTQSTWRVNVAGLAFTDSQGHAWQSDLNFDGGNAATSAAPVGSTSDSALYQKERWASDFGYIFDVPAGNYQVTLKFAESYFSGVGQRVFDVSINGFTKLSQFDPYAAAGGINIAVDRVFRNIVPDSSGRIQIHLGPSQVDHAKLCAIEIIPQPNTPSPSPTVFQSPTSTVSPTLRPTLSDSPSLTRTPSRTASPSFTATGSFTVTLTLSPSVSLTASPSVTPTLSASTSPTLSYTPTQSLSPSFTATGSFTVTLTLSPSVSPTASPTISATASQSPSPSLTVTVSASMSTSPQNSKTVTGSISPTRVLNGPLAIESAVAAPNPVQGNILRLSYLSLGSSDSVELRLYTADQACVLHQEWKNSTGQGWHQLQVDLPGLTNGIYYFRLRLERGEKNSAPVLGKIFLAR